MAEAVPFQENFPQSLKARGWHLAARRDQRGRGAAVGGLKPDLFQSDTYALMPIDVGRVHTRAKTPTCFQ
jgi:hypothetical protein